MEVREEACYLANKEVMSMLWMKTIVLVFKGISCVSKIPEP
jgi:hypothetical protein